MWLPLEQGLRNKEGRARLGIQEKAKSQGATGLRTSPSLWSENSEVFEPGDQSKVGSCPQVQGQTRTLSSTLQRGSH